MKGEMEKHDGAAAPPWPPGGGEMGARIRALDWAITPLGPVEGWPESLRTAVGIMLTTRHPVGISWGPDLVCLYNDAHAASLGPEQHPISLGIPIREAWPEAYPLVAAEFAQIMAGGEPIWAENRLVPIRRHGRVENVFWTYSRSPIRDSGAPNGVGGVLTLVTETTSAVTARLESEARYRALVEAMDEGYGLGDVILDAEGHPVDVQFIEVNPAATRMCGVEAGMRLSQISSDARPYWCEIWGEVARTGRPARLERYAAALGAWYASHIFKVAPEDEASRRVAVLVRDATERKRAEERLRASEARLHRVLEVRTVGMVCFTFDGRITDANDAYLDMIGATREDLAAGRLRYDYLTPLDWRWRDGQTSAELKTLGESGPFEKECYRKDGSRFWICCTSKMLPDGTAVEFVLDVTERKRAQEAMRESEGRFRQFAEASSDAVWIRDARTLAMEYMNPAFETIYGVGDTAFLDGSRPERWAELIHPEDRAAALGVIRKVGRGEAVTHEFRIVRPADGRVRWLQNTDFPLRDVHGRVQRVGGFGKDITEAKELSDRLKVLVAELQHRTRNLISVVRSVADQTLAGSVSLDMFQEHFRRRLGALARVNGLLSRLNEGDRIAFDELVLAELATHGVVIRAGHSPQVALEGPRGVFLRSATVQTFALALHELATNARKYGALSRPEGRLRIEWEVVSGGDGGPHLRMDWSESGVPVPMLGDGQFLQNGYGRELIEHALPYQLEAKTSYEIGPDSIHCTICLPISARYEGVG